MSEHAHQSVIFVFAYGNNAFPPNSVDSSLKVETADASTRYDFSRVIGTFGFVVPQGPLERGVDNSVGVI